MKYRSRKWNSLTDFRDFLLKSGKEEVLEFNGAELITNKGKYGLAFSKLSFYPRKEN